jgi:transcriptional regulator with XRE-family HTH domain
VARESKRWTQRELAEHMTVAGWPIERSVIAKIEAGGRRTDNVSLDETLALAAVLGMSPLYLFIPWDDTAMVAVTPKMPAQSRHVRPWVAGQTPLHMKDIDKMTRKEREAYLEHGTPDEQFFYYMKPPSEYMTVPANEGPSWQRPRPAKKGEKPNEQAQ